MDLRGFSRLPQDRRLKALSLALAASALLAALLYVGARYAGGEAEPQVSLIRVETGPVTGTLDEALKAEGLDDKARAGITRALRKKVDFRRLRPEDTYEVAFSSGGKLTSFSLTQGLRTYSLLPDGKGGFEYAAFTAQLSSASLTAAGEIASSLWESMAAKNIPPAVILDFAEVFSWSVDFLTEVRAGDKWALAWEERREPSGRLASQRITAAVYNGAAAGRQTAAWRRGGYYDEKGEAQRSMFLRAPLNYRRISSYFTNRRFHPVLKYFRPHHGIDYAAPRGTPVSAVADGTVTYAGWKGGNGKLVIVRHSAGYESTYGHLSNYGRGVRGGKRVNQGDVIGYVGSTGLSSGPHLDFRLKHNGKPLNFLKIKRSTAGKLSREDTREAAAAIAALGL